MSQPYCESCGRTNDELEIVDDIRPCVYEGYTVNLCTECRHESLVE